MQGDLEGKKNKQTNPSTDSLTAQLGVHKNSVGGNRLRLLAKVTSVGP